DPERKLWYCDIEVDPGDAYYPFVRIALARYQAHSVPDAHLSRVVMTDFIQLAPDRTAEVSLSDDRALVEVSGFSGRNRVADLSRPSFLPSEAPAAIDGVVARDAPLASTTVRVALERRLAGVPGDLGWERVSPEITLAPARSRLRVRSILGRQSPPF